MRGEWEEPLQSLQQVYRPTMPTGLTVCVSNGSLLDNGIAHLLIYQRAFEAY